MARHGWVRVDGGVVRMTEEAGRARDEWGAAMARAESTWPAATSLRAPLEAFVPRLPLEHSHYPCGYGAADWRITGGSGVDWTAVHRDPEADTVSSLSALALLSQALVGFAVEYESRVPFAIVVGVHLDAAFADGPVLLDDAPPVLMITGNGRSSLERHGAVEVDRSKRVILTSVGRRLRDAYRPTVEAVESSLEARRRCERLSRASTSMSSAMLFIQTSASSEATSGSPRSRHAHRRYETCLSAPACRRMPATERPPRAGTATPTTQLHTGWRHRAVSETACRWCCEAPMTRRQRSCEAHDVLAEVSARCRAVDQTRPYHRAMQIMFLAGFGPIGKDQRATHEFWAHTIGIDFQEPAPGYYHASGLDGARAFALWPLERAAQATFGSGEWPSDRPAPQAWVEVEVASPEAVADAVEDCAPPGRRSWSGRTPSRGVRRPRA